LFAVFPGLGDVLLESRPFLVVRDPEFIHHAVDHRFLGLLVRRLTGFRQVFGRAADDARSVLFAVAAGLALFFGGFALGFFLFLLVLLLCLLCLLFAGLLGLLIGFLVGVLVLR